MELMAQLVISALVSSACSAIVRRTLGLTFLLVNTSTIRSSTSTPCSGRPAFASALASVRIARLSVMLSTPSSAIDACSTGWSSSMLFSGSASRISSTPSADRSLKSRCALTPSTSLA